MTGFDDLSKAFGKQLARRIIACAILQGEKLEGREGFEDDTAVLRFTIGMIKRMRKQAIESGQSMTWENAVERLEMEQEEGQHYTFQSSLGIAYKTQLQNEVERIEERNGAIAVTAKAKGVSVWSLKVEMEAQRLEDAMTQKAVDASDVSIVLAGIFASWTPRRLSWFKKVLAGLRRGEELTKAQRKTIHDYTPAGVTASEFVELAVRYA